MTRDTFDMFQRPDRGRFGDNESIRGNDSVRSDLVDLTLNFRSETPLAIAVTDPATAKSKWVWLPKSGIEFEAKGKGFVEVTMPASLAKEKGLI
jgi:hypothetical protein